MDKRKRMMPLIIRPATLGDVDDRAHLHVDAWRWAYRGLMPDDFLDALDPAKRAAVWANMLNDEAASAPHVARADDRVVGFCHAGRSRDEDATDDVGEVTAIYLAANFVGTGTGRRLWNAALDQLRQAHHSTVTVWILDTNTRGRAFYERVGMTPDGATKSDDLRGFPITEVRYRGQIGQADL